MSGRGPPPISSSSPRLRPRNWFAVHFGCKAVPKDEYLEELTRRVVERLLAENSPINRQPFSRTIRERDNVNVIVSSIDVHLDQITAQFGQIEAGPQFPLIVVLDDQSLLDLHDKLAEHFSERAFLYSMKGHKLLEAIGGQSWTFLNAYMKELARTMNEFDPCEEYTMNDLARLEPRRELPAPPQTRAKPSHQRREEAGDSRDGRDRNRTEGSRPHEGSTGRNSTTRSSRDVTPPTISERSSHGQSSRSRDREDRERDRTDIQPYGSTSRSSSSDRRVNDRRRLPISEEKLYAALERSRTDKAIRNNLAEEMESLIDVAGTLVPPFYPREEDRMKLLDLFVIAAESGAFDEDDRLDVRRALMKQVVESGLILMVKSLFIDRTARTLGPRTSAKDLSLMYEGILIVLRSFSVLSHLECCQETDEVVTLWIQTEQNVFELPAAFWRSLNPKQIDQIVDVACQVTDDSNREMYQLCIASKLREEGGVGSGDGPPGLGSCGKAESWGTTETTCGYQDVGPPPGLERNGRGGGDRGDTSDHYSAPVQWPRPPDPESLETLPQEGLPREPNAAEMIMIKQEAERRRALCEELRITNWDECEKTEPPVPFRKMEDRPVVEELFERRVPYLRRCIIDGTYRDNEHYLDVQFRLMREDMVSPLRDGIFLYRESGVAKNKGFERGPNAINSDLTVAAPVTVSGIQIRPQSGEKMRFITLSNEALHAIDPMRNCRFGQVICLSSDCFQKNFHIGLVVERGEDDTPFSGRVGVSFFDEGRTFDLPGIDNSPLAVDKRYALAEPSSYFEAYWHVLQVMKSMPQYRVFPCERYLVYGKTNTRLPLYMRVKETEDDEKEDDEITKKYEELRKENKTEKSDEEKKKKMKLKNCRSPSTESESDDDFEEPILPHPSPSDLERITIGSQSYSVKDLKEEYKPENLDDTQQDAMCYALRSELAIIQGPPGTGKTHIGVEMVMALLANRTRWRVTQPILIVTYTNQALDQFLEKIYKRMVQTPELEKDAIPMVRLGSRSESEFLQQNDILFREVMDVYGKDYESRAECAEMRSCQNVRRIAASNLLSAVRIVRQSKKDIFAFNTLKLAMDPTHEMNMRAIAGSMVDSNGLRLNLDEALACWLMDKDYRKSRESPNEENLVVDDRIDFGVRVATSKSSDEKKDGSSSKSKKERRREERARKSATTPAEGVVGEEDGEVQEILERADEEMEVDEDDEALLDEKLREAFEEMRLEANESLAKLENEARWNTVAEKYDVETVWEMEKARNMNIKDVNTIFSCRVKGGPSRQLRAAAVDNMIVKDLEEIKETILSAEPMTKEEVEAQRNLKTVPRGLRRRMLMYWQEECARMARGSLDMMVASYESACKRLVRAQRKYHAVVLRRALIIGATTTGAAKRRKLLKEIGPRQVVVEEAAEVLEAHLLTSLVPSIQHAIFIGDHQQLRPNPAVYDLATHAGLEISLFERLIKAGYPFRTLGLQHRMLPLLTKSIVRPYFYGLLQDAPSVSLYPQVRGMAQPMFLWAHETAEEYSVVGTSRRNRHEVNMAFALAYYLILQGQYRPNEITIIATYAAQVAELRAKFERERTSENRTEDVVIETVDSYQGKENKIVILSMVRSNTEGIGFLKTANRMCVALTRAQHGFYILGNLNFLAAFSDLWEEIRTTLIKLDLVDYAIPVKCQRHGHVQLIKYVSDFVDKARTGGCTEDCGMAMTCGHECRLRCHPPYQHETQPSSCNEQCTKTCERCGKRCRMMCGEECGDCEAWLSNHQLDCGHSVSVKCKNASTATCPVPCPVVLPCGHQCASTCSAPCTTAANCERKVLHRFPRCRHECPVPCNAVSGHGKLPASRLPCPMPCGEKLACQHDCPRTCGEPCPLDCTEEVEIKLKRCGHLARKTCSASEETVRCQEPVTVTLPVCGHTIELPCEKQHDATLCRTVCGKLAACGHLCKRPCGECFREGYNHACRRPCEKHLPCGHPCASGCGLPCASCQSTCRRACSHQQCGWTSGSNSFGRRCSEACVLCKRVCDNKCRHRVCSRRCFEVCDVAACEEPCVAKLSCGHACMGMCGEQCPALCGSCSMERYKGLVAKYLGDVKGEVKRLIQIGDCGHSFPVEYLDGSVTKQQDAGRTLLACPECGGSMNDVKRYGKTRRRMEEKLEAEKKTRREAKWSGKDVLEMHDAVRKSLKESHRALCNMYSTVLNTGTGGGGGGGKKKERRLPDTVRAMFDIANDAFSRIIQYSRIPVEKEKKKDTVELWTIVADCVLSICNLTLVWIREGVDLRLDGVSNDLMNLKGVVLDVYNGKRNQRFVTVRDALQDLCDTLLHGVETKRPGLFVPELRRKILEFAILLHGERLHAYVVKHARETKDETGSGGDIPFEVAKNLRRMVKLFRYSGPCEFPENVLERIVKDIDVEVYEKMLHDTSLQYDFLGNVKLPNF